MNGSDEERDVEAVVHRLADRFPDVAREHVAEVVTGAHRQLEGNRIRDFVPVLVEHDARGRLRAEGARPTPRSDSADAAAGPTAPAAAPRSLGRVDA
jgi:hypothetical protein